MGAFTTNLILLIAYRDQQNQLIPHNPTRHDRLSSLEPEPVSPTRPLAQALRSDTTRMHPV